MPISKGQLKNDEPEIQAAVVSDPPTGPGRGAFYPKEISGVVEAVYKDDQGRIIQLTSNGGAAGGGGGGSVSDIAYDVSSWDGVTSTAPSKNAVRDKFVSVDSAVSGKLANTLVSQALMEAGTDNNAVAMSPLRVAQAIAALGGGGGSVSDVAYDATSWNGVTSVAPSKNAVRDIIETLSAAITAKQDDLAVPSQAEAEAGTSTAERVWTAQRVAQAIAALAPGGGGSISDVAYDQTTWDSVTTVAPSKNAVRDKFVSVDSAVSGKLANTLVSQALMEAGTDNNAVAMSPLRVAQAIAALAPGGGSSNEYRFTLPAAASINARIAGAVGLPGGWSLNTADAAGDATFSTSADTLIVTWDAGLGAKIAEVSVFQSTTGGPASLQGVTQIDTWAASLVKTNPALTKVGVYLNGLGVSTSKDLYVLVRLV